MSVHFSSDLFSLFRTTPDGSTDTIREYWQDFYHSTVVSQDKRQIFGVPTFPHLHLFKANSDW